MHTIYVWPDEGYIYTVVKKDTKDIIYAEMCGALRLVDLIRARKKRPLRIVAEHSSCVKDLYRLVKDIKISVSAVEYIPLRKWEEEQHRLQQTDYRGPEEEMRTSQSKRTCFNPLTFSLIGILCSLLVAFYFIVIPFLNIHSLNLERRLNDSIVSLQYLEAQVSATVLWDVVLSHYPDSIIEHIEIDHHGDFSVIFLNPTEGLQLKDKYNFADMVLEQGQRVQGSGETAYIIYVLRGRSVW